MVKEMFVKAIIKCGDCSKILTDNEIKFYGHTCEGCEQKAHARMYDEEPVRSERYPTLIDKWDAYFFKHCEAAAGMSKDPSAKVGAVIVGEDRQILSTGYNGFPRGIEDTAERLNNRDEKLKLVVHGEMNAVLNAARYGIKTKGTTMYMLVIDSTGKIWGGAPCTRCTVELIQSGIKEIVTLPIDRTPERWLESVQLSHSLLKEAGITIRQVEYY